VPKARELVWVWALPSFREVQSAARPRSTPSHAFVLPRTHHIGALGAHSTTLSSG
jgi:hypothetical protein